MAIAVIAGDASEAEIAGPLTPTVVMVVVYRSRVTIAPTYVEDPGTEGALPTLLYEDTVEFFGQDMVGVTSVPQELLFRCEFLPPCL